MTSRRMIAVLSVALVIGCEGDDNGANQPEVDGTPPAAVTDLAAGMPTSRSLTLTWTAVGDDGATGTASQYDLRFSTDQSTAWDQMTQAKGEPAPHGVGDAESFTVKGLAPNTAYHFMVNVADEAPNWSGVSNAAAGTTTEAEMHDGMVWIPAGNVRIGQAGISNAEPIHDFYVEGFYIDIYEVTNAEYKEFIDAGGYRTEEYWDEYGWDWRVSKDITLPVGWNNDARHGGGIPGNETFPVTGVSWWEADAYSRWAGKRLPTEPEWEKASKGGCEIYGDSGQCDAADTPDYPWGEMISGRRANYWNSGDPYEYRGSSTPAGYYDGSNHGGYQTIDSPSPYGLYDVAGNAWEWCSTRYADYPYDPDDGREGPGLLYEECCRVLRGGSWYYYYSTVSLRCAHRAYYRPDRRFSYFGFRCARSD